MSDFNIYDDLELLHERNNEKKVEDAYWNERYQTSLRIIENLRTEKRDLGKRIKHLEENFESLLETARAEIRRKDNQIAELRREKDDICFRRNVNPEKRYFAEDGDSKHAFGTEPQSHVSYKNSYGNERTNFLSKGDANLKSSSTMKYLDSKNIQKENFSELTIFDDKTVPGSCNVLAKERSNIKKVRTDCVENDKKLRLLNEMSSLEIHKQKNCNTKEMHLSTSNKMSAEHLKNVVTKEEILTDVKNLNKAKSLEALCIVNPDNVQKKSSEKSQHFFDALFDDIVRENKNQPNEKNTGKNCTEESQIVSPLKQTVSKSIGESYQDKDYSDSEQMQGNMKPFPTIIKEDKPYLHKNVNDEKPKNQEVSLFKENIILVQDKSLQLMKPIYISNQMQTKKSPTPEKKTSMSREHISNHVETAKADNGLRGSEASDSDAKDEKNDTCNGEYRRKETLKNVFKSRNSGSNNTNEKIHQRNQNAITTTTLGKKAERTYEMYPNNCNFLRSFEKSGKKLNMISYEERLYTSNKRILKSVGESLNCGKKENGFTDCSKKKLYPNIVLETNDVVCGCIEKKMCDSDLESIIKRSKQKRFLNPPKSDLNSCQAKVQSPPFNTSVMCLEQTMNCLDDQMGKDKNICVDPLLVNNAQKHFFKTINKTKNICPFIDLKTNPTKSIKHANVYNDVACYVDIQTHEEKPSKNCQEMVLKENRQIKSQYVASSGDAYLETRKHKMGKCTNETILIDHSDLITFFDRKTKRKKFPENYPTGSKKVIVMTEAVSVDEVRPIIIKNKSNEFVKDTTSKDMNEVFQQKDNMDVAVSSLGPSCDVACFNDYGEERASSGRRKKLKTPIKCTEELYSTFASSSGISTAQQTTLSENKMGLFIGQETDALSLKKMPISLSILASTNDKPNVEIYSKKMYSKETCDDFCSDREDLNPPDMPALQIEEELSQFVSSKAAHSLFKENKQSDLCVKEECTQSFSSTEAKSLFEASKSIMPLDHKVNAFIKENASLTQIQSRKIDACVYPADADKKTVLHLNCERGSLRNQFSEKPKSDELLSLDDAAVKQVNHSNGIEKSFKYCEPAVNDSIKQKQNYFQGLEASNDMKILPLSSINLSSHDHFQKHFEDMISLDKGSVERPGTRYENEHKIISPNQCESGQDGKIINKKLSPFNIIDSVSACPNKKNYKQVILENVNSKFENHENIQTNPSCSKPTQHLGVGLDCTEAMPNVCQTADAEPSTNNSHQLTYKSLHLIDSHNSIKYKKLTTHKKNILRNYFATGVKNVAYVAHCESNYSTKKKSQVGRKDTNVRSEIASKLDNIETNKIKLDSLRKISSRSLSLFINTSNNNQNSPSNTQQSSFQICDTADNFQDSSLRCDKKISVKVNNKYIDSLTGKIMTVETSRATTKPQSRGLCENKLNKNCDSIAHEPIVSNNIYITRKIKPGKRVKASQEENWTLSTLLNDKLCKSNSSTRDHYQESSIIKIEKSNARDQLKMQLSHEPTVPFISHETFSNDKVQCEHPALLRNIHYNSSLQNDEKYQEIDNCMRFIFQSPTATEIENLTIDETLDQSNKSECDTLLSRKVSVGSNDYIIESVGALTANVFVTRKKGKKRLKISTETTQN